MVSFFLLVVISPLVKKRVIRPIEIRHVFVEKNSPVFPGDNVYTSRVWITGDFSSKRKSEFNK
jgi:hypothetical protein